MRRDNRDCRDYRDYQDGWGGEALRSRMSWRSRVSRQKTLQFRVFRQMELV